MQNVPGRARGGRPRLALVIASAVAVGLLASVARADVLVSPGSTKVGDASWYGRQFENRPTATGDRFDPYAMTCAHRTLPLGTRVMVTNLRNGRSVMLTINDRGPYRHGRELDVSLGAARALGFSKRGIERVLIEPMIGS
jgi:rare lipoprotein A